MKDEGNSGSFEFHGKEVYELQHHISGSQRTIYVILKFLVSCMLVGYLSLPGHMYESNPGLLRHIVNIFDLELNDLGKLADFDRNMGLYPPIVDKDGFASPEIIQLFLKPLQPLVELVLRGFNGGV